jgi:hypothetical protein
MANSDKMLDDMLTRQMKGLLLRIIEKENYILRTTSARDRSDSGSKL